MVRERQRFGSWVLALASLLGVFGCAAGSSGHVSGAYEPGMARQGHDLRQDHAPVAGAPQGTRGSSLFDLFGEKKDSFQVLQDAAGLGEEERHEAQEELEPRDARKLWNELARSRTTLNNFAPRRTLIFLLREVLAAGEDVSYEELVQRTQRFRLLVVMRPDGYLAAALNGQPLQRMGQLALREGRLMSGSFEVGGFYRDRGGVFYAVDGALQPVRWPPLGELGLEHDWFNSALDGAGDALEEMVVGLATLITDPIRGAAGLAQLPAAVAALILSSPEYFARYSTRPLKEQIREAARLSTHLIMLYGSAAGASTRAATAGTSVPVLSLTAEGAVAVEQVAVPVGSTAVALGAGAGAVYVVMAAEKAPESGDASPAQKEPGEWRRKKFAGSDRARRYQEQITGRSPDEVYTVGTVEFDGFKAGVFKEAKGPGYLEFFEKNGNPKAWYEKSGKFQELIDQATNQSKTARGIPVQWHIAERELVGILRRHFDEAFIQGIELFYTPPVP
jgi:hypothetical protein